MRRPVAQPRRTLAGAPHLDLRAGDRVLLPRLRAAGARRRVGGATERRCGDARSSSRLTGATVAARAARAAGSGAHASAAETRDRSKVRTPHAATAHAARSQPDA